MKTAELTGELLNYWVARAEGLPTIGESAVDLIPEEVRRPDYYRLESFRFILPPGYHERMGSIYCHRDGHGNVIDFAPRVKPGVWVVRQAWVIKKGGNFE